VPGEYPPHPHSRPAASTSSPIQFTGSRRKMRIMAQQGSPLRQADELETARTTLTTALQALFTAEKAIFKTGIGNDPYYAGYLLKTQELITAAEEIYFAIDQPISRDALLPLLQALDIRSAFRELEQFQGAVPNVEAFMQAVSDFSRTVTAMKDLLANYEAPTQPGQQPEEQPAGVPGEYPSTMDENETRGNVGWATR